MAGEAEGETVGERWCERGASVRCGEGTVKCPWPTCAVGEAEGERVEEEEGDIDGLRFARERRSSFGLGLLLLRELLAVVKA